MVQFKMQFEYITFNDIATHSKTTMHKKHTISKFTKERIYLLKCSVNAIGFLQLKQLKVKFVR